MNLRTTIFVCMLVPSVAHGQESVQPVIVSSTPEPFNWDSQQRARLTPTAGWSLTPRGSRMPLGGPLNELCIVLEHDEDSARVVIPGSGSFSGADFAVYVRSEELEYLFDGRGKILPSDLDPKRVAKGKEAFVIPPPGTIAKVVGRPDSKRVKVTTEYVAAGIAIEVWGNTSAGSLAKVITKRSERHPSTTRGTFSVAAELILLEKPDGAPFIRSNEPIEAADVYTVATKGGFSLVQLDGTNVRGWISTKKLQKSKKHRNDAHDDDLNGVVLGAISGNFGTTKPEELPIGTMLFDRPNGTAVGEVRRAKVRALAQQKNSGWTRFAVNTDIGNLTVWARQ